MYLHIHIPKTGGSSFRTGTETFLKSLYDYGRDSEYTSAVIKATTYSNKIDSLPHFIKRASIDMISGHFPACKYSSLFPEAKMITFFRDPISRIISEYNFLSSLGAVSLKFEQFCELPSQQNKQSRLISGTELKDFHFIGITECFSESICRFNKLSGLSIPELDLRPGKKLESNSPDKLRLESIAKDYLDFLREINKEDLILYQQAFAQFKTKSS